MPDATSNPAETPQPTTDPGFLASQLPQVGQATFAALASEPSTGVGIITLDGQVVYLNEQAARIFHGDEAKPAEYVGRFWRDYMPEEWVSERLRMLRAMLIHDKPVLMRTIWRGFQHFTWITRIEREARPRRLSLIASRPRKKKASPASRNGSQPRLSMFSQRAAHHARRRRSNAP